MSGQNGTPEKHGGEAGGAILSRTDLLVLQKQAAKFPFKPEDRERACEMVMDVMKTTKSKKTILTAVRTMAVLERVNIRQSEVEVADRHNDILESATVFREAMRSPEIREALAKLSDKTTEELSAPELNGKHNGSS